MGLGEMQDRREESLGDGEVGVGRCWEMDERARYERGGRMRADEPELNGWSTSPSPCARARERERGERERERAESDLSCPTSRSVRRGLLG